MNDKLKDLRQVKIELWWYYHARTVRESKVLTMDVSAEDILCRWCAEWMWGELYVRTHTHTHTHTPHTTYNIRREHFILDNIITMILYCHAYSFRIKISLFTIQSFQLLFDWLKETDPSGVNEIKEDIRSWPYSTTKRWNIRRTNYNTRSKYVHMYVHTYVPCVKPPAAFLCVRLWVRFPVKKSFYFT